MSRRRQVISVSQGFGARLTEALADQRVTQQALAERLHASPSFVSALVRGLKAPGLEFIVALHGVLGVSLNWLILGRGQMYGDEMDSDLFQGALLQVQLARLATSERRPEAAVLLRNALPDVDLPPPLPPPAAERLDAFLDALLTGNQDVPVAISLMNTALLRVPAPDRPQAIAVAIEEMVRSRLSPSILHLLKPAAVEAVANKRDTGDNINWEREPLPPADGRQIGELPKRPPPRKRASTTSTVKPTTTRTEPLAEEVHASDKPDSGDNINWERQPLPPADGRKIGELPPHTPLIKHASTSSTAKPKTRRAKKQQ